MPYLLLSEGCRGRNIEFIEQGGEFLSRPAGKEFSGRLGLQIFSDRNYKRIAFTDGKNVWIGAAKKLFGIGSAVHSGNAIKGYQKGNQDYLCHFDFAESELHSGKKKIEYVAQTIGLTTVCGLSCYDLKTHTGCMYLFPSRNEGKKWAKQIGITQMKILDEDGNLSSTVSL